MQQEQTSGFRFVGVLMLTMQVILVSGLFILGGSFNYPAIAEAPGGELLTAFSRNADLVSAMFYLWAIAEMLRMVVALGLHQLFTGPSTRYFTIFTLFGVLAGLLRMLDYILWPFLVRTLAEIYTNPASSEAAREAAAVDVNGLFAYLGDALGGNLGILFILVWVVGLGATMLRTGLFPRWLGWAGIVVGFGYLLNYIEFTGTTQGAIGTAGLIAHISINLWQIVVACYLLRGVRPTVGNAVLAPNAA
jgi:hypothetical protein